MLQIGVQTKNVVHDTCPEEGFRMLKDAGFSCADFSLNQYLLNTDLYAGKINPFFAQSVQELKNYFTPHKEGAAAAGITVNQMHMPYPIFIPNGKKEINDFLWKEVAPKSLELCHFFDCKNIVVHGFKLARYLGTEDAEWEYTERFLDYIAPMAKEMGITMCIENLYDGVGGHLLEGPCCNAKKAADRIDRFNERHGAEVLGFCLDTGHANLVGLDMESFIQTLGTRLKVLHIHDNDGVSDLHQIPFTFTKTRENRTSTDWAGFLNGLASISYSHVLSFETAPVLSAFPEGLKQEALAFIAKIGIYFSEQVERHN